MRQDVQQQVADLLALIRDLTEPATRAESTAELFTGAFRALDGCVPFDLGAAVMLEQHLDLYVFTRESAAAQVNDRLIAKLREMLAASIAVSFAETDVVVKSELRAVGEGPGLGDLAHATSAIIRIHHRTAGMVMLFRGAEPFGLAEEQIVEIFAAQVAMLLAQLSARAEIRGLADTDDLTGIGNKRSLRRHLAQEVERARVYNLPLSVLMIDVDDFKTINDRHGHTIGDVVLSELCGAVRETLRPPDIFARFGGDEFAVILPHTDLAGARTVAERILECVRLMEIPAEDEESIRCAVSVGVAAFDGDGSAGDLLRRADERLYESKRAGKNRYTA